MEQRIRTFEKATLDAATNNWSTELVLGRGGSGIVYRGLLEDENGEQEREIAVKCMLLPALDARTQKHFKAEVNALADLSHPHIVPLLGVCVIPKDNRVMLVYKYLAGGSLDYYLHGGLNDVHLTWLQRLRICRDVGMGLNYLHQNRVLHRDIKPANIVLDRDLNGFLTDFGLARKLPTENSYIRTEVFGTRGYMDPMYLSSGSVCIKSDVYSFGVMLLEVITGRHVIIDGIDLVRWLKPFISNKRPQMDGILDPALRGTVHPKVFHNAILVAKLCTRLDLQERPRMDYVTQMMNRLVAEAGLVQAEF